MLNFLAWVPASTAARTKVNVQNKITVLTPHFEHGPFQIEGIDRQEKKKKSRVAMRACPAPTFALGEAKLCLLIQIKEVNAIKHMDKLENRFSSAKLIPVEF